jgi:hypothetical protein
VDSCEYGNEPSSSLRDHIVLRIDRKLISSEGWISMEFGYRRLVCSFLGIKAVGT